ncbi:hypothetical protein PDR31_28825 [Bacillus cereus]|nr:hypothetical protein [Bacillus cereus]
MVDRKIILDAYKKGPEAVISLFEETFSKLEKRIQELEHASKKTLQIVISHLLQMVCVNRLQKVCAIISASNRWPVGPQGAYTSFDNDS